jgi:HD-GYP domain-containing protein (c-di-GMP phosphodiesterase class II)
MDKLNYQALVKVGQSLISERSLTKLCELILDEAQSLCHAEAGTIYLANQQPATTLQFAIVHNSKLNTRLIANEGESLFPAVPLYDEQGAVNQHHVVAHAAHARTLVNVPDAYDSSVFDFSGAKYFDQQNNYRTKSVLAVPLLNDMNQLIGMLQLINARDENSGEIIPFPEALEPMITALASFAAAAIENRSISENQRALLIALAASNKTEDIIERILDESKALTHAEGGTLYLLQQDTNGKQGLKFEIISNDKLNIYLGGKSAQPVPFKPIDLRNADGSANHNNVAAYSANTKQVVNIADVYTAQDFDFSGAQAFDKQTGYRTQSLLCLPLLNHRQEVIGVIQLVNARHPDSGAAMAFSEKYIPLIKGLALYAAIALNNQILVADLKRLLDAFIKSIAKAIDAKSPHTSGHCQRVPLMTELLAKAACKDEGTFKDFRLNDDEWYELQVASWMHDCGKLATPDSVLDKSTKLHTMRDGIDTVLTRIANLKQQKHIEYLQAIARNPALQDELHSQLSANLAQLDADAAFLTTANKGGEFMSDEHKNRVRSIAHYQWQDHQGEQQNLLSDDEVKNLCIERGTLTAEERQIINNHMVVTIEMLEALPFPKQLRKVPEYAGGHHEKMDGTGFPRGLKREQMSIPARMMAIADIFEALTAKDRPYKAPMPVSVALGIMQRMRNDNHIDPDIYQLFINARVWEKYATKVLAPEQLDISDASSYL